MSTTTLVQDAPGDDLRDLGFGSRIAQQGARLLNRDGSFNVAREGIAFLRTLNPYHALITISWPKFYAMVLSSYLVINLLFASAFLLCGPQALRGAEGTTFHERVLDAFFFSVQTLATIGYGRISPEGVAANTLVAAEALVGMLGFAMATALAFARFSRPSAQILFSRHAVIAPYKGITAFEFRIVNERSNQIIDLRAKVVMSRLEMHDGKSIRKFHPLHLERDTVVFLPLQWVVVHPIDEKSPLSGVTSEALLASAAEFLILLTGTDETFSQAVHARSSYRADEVVVGARFRDMYLPSHGGVVRVDLRRLHEIEAISA